MILFFPNSPVSCLASSSQSPSLQLSLHTTFKCWLLHDSCHGHPLSLHLFWAISCIFMTPDIQMLLTHKFLSQGDIFLLNSKHIINFYVVIAPSYLSHKSKTLLINIFPKTMPYLIPCFDGCYYYLPSLLSPILESHPRALSLLNSTPNPPYPFL